MPKELHVDLSKYIYTLPEAKIAFAGTIQRDESKLLYYKNGVINDHVFDQISDLIPSNSTLVFNNTKVIPARLQFYKNTGGKVEIFLLKPANNNEISLALESTKPILWECMIGNLKKWKENEVLTTSISVNNQQIELNVKLVDRASKIVKFRWNEKHISFSQLIDNLGITPLPPYIKRKVTEDDKDRYQTVYSKVNGAVAAPTAGLHFTSSILDKLTEKGVQQKHLTLHVGAGTFMPIKAATVKEHPMHNEAMIVPLDVIESVIDSTFIIPVGTTSMRTLESLYWFGVKLLKNTNACFHIDKLYPYEERDNLPTQIEAFNAILEYAKTNNLTSIIGETEIFIFPGYKFRVCQGLITNFHQPESTLILLVAAFVGENWEDIYTHALKNDYRFLSFGDSSLLIPKKK